MFNFYVVPIEKAVKLTIFTWNLDIVCCEPKGHCFMDELQMLSLKGSS